MLMPWCCHPRSLWGLEGVESRSSQCRAGPSSFGECAGAVLQRLMVLVGEVWLHISLACFGCCGSVHRAELALLLKTLAIVRYTPAFSPDRLVQG